MQVWGEFVATLLAFGGHFGASFGPYRRRMAGVMRIGAGFVGLKAKMCTAFEPEAKSRRA